MAIPLFSIVGSIFIKDQEALKNMENTEKKAKKLDKELGKLSKSAIEGAKQMGVAFGIAAGALGGLVMKSIEATSRIEDMSAKLGLSKASFQEWDYVLGQNGISIDSLQGSLNKMNNVIDDASKGSKSASDSLANLGLSFEDLQGKTRTEIFDLVITKLQGVTDENKRAALANDIFGKSSAELGPILGKSATDIETMKQKARDLGLVLSDELITAGDDVGDKMDDVKASFGAVTTQLGAQFLPKLNELLTWVLANMPKIQATMDTVFTAIADAIIWVSDNSKWLIPVLAGVVAGFVAFNVVTTITNAIAAFNAVIALATSVTGLFNAVLMANPILIIAVAVGILVAALVAMGVSFEDIIDGLSKGFKWFANGFIGVVNSVITGINSMISGFLWPFNALIKGFNDTVGKAIGLTVPQIKVSIPTIPKLAEGGLAFASTLAIVGDNRNARSDPEVIAPLSKLNSIMANSAMAIDYNALARAMSNIKIELDGDKVGEFVDNRIVGGMTI